MKRAIIGLLASVLFLGTAIAQSPDLVSFGNIHMSTTGHSAPPLRIRSAGLSSLRSYRFVGRVGGVSFEQVAVPATGTPQLSGIRYVPTRPDGQRVQVRIQSSWLTVDAHDWEVAPIAEFAESRYHAAVSLFGEGPNPETYFYIQYASAFRDTLLGLRLLHADVLLIDPENFSGLPTIGGSVPLGGGETRGPARQSTSQQIQIMNAQRLLATHSPQSWVLTDTDAQVSYRRVGNSLSLDGGAYYSFWSMPKSGGLDEAEFERRMSRALNATDLEAQYNAAIAAGNSARVTEIEQRVMEIGTQIQEELLEVDLVSELINHYRNNPDDLRTLNPNVFDAVQTTSELAALFRHARQVSPTQWRTFRTAVSRIDPSPAVSTPRTMNRYAQ